MLKHTRLAGGFGQIPRGSGGLPRFYYLVAGPDLATTRNCQGHFVTSETRRRTHSDIPHSISPSRADASLLQECQLQLLYAQTHRRLYECHQQSIISTSDLRWTLPFGYIYTTCKAWRVGNCWASSTHYITFHLYNSPCSMHATSPVSAALLHSS